MLDEIRRGDWVPRSVHRNGRQIAEAMHAIQRREGRPAQDREIADELGGVADPVSHHAGRRKSRQAAGNG
ncbi:hypothetical protein MBH78_12420 [Oceanimonas sp. NS1]|nr:hypothetical protein [Oceanimonas sp. NS1]